MYMVSTIIISIKCVNKECFTLVCYSTQTTELYTITAAAFVLKSAFSSCKLFIGDLASSVRIGPDNRGCLKHKIIQEGHQKITTIVQNVHIYSLQ